jgi:phage gpG-like protein
MPVKIKGLTKLDKKLTKMLPDARSIFAKEMKRSIVDILVEKITSGLSPVKGQNRYKKYSDAYAKTKGRKEPVDLVGSGEMLNNMIARQTNKNNIIVEFRGKSRKIASYHNNGTDKMPQRKILPSGKEIFKSDIMNKIVNILQKAINKTLK